MKRILGYTDKLTVRPGGKIAFKISTGDGVQYRAQLVRLINGDSHSSEAGFKEIEIGSPVNGAYTGREQPLVPGSCIVVESARPLTGLEAFTVAVAFMPTAPGQRRQQLISHSDHDAQAGWSLYLNPEGMLCFSVTDQNGRSSTALTTVAVSAGKWYQAAARICSESRTITLDCIPLPSSRVLPPAPPCRQTAQLDCDPPRISVPLLIAAKFAGFAANGNVIPIESFDGRIEAPVIYRRQLTDAELGAVLAGARPSALHSRLIADWDFSIGIGSTTITDRSVNCLHGVTHNLPLRAVKSSRWDGSEMNWRYAPSHYSAIHFHADDLYDCDWQTDILYRVPDDLKSGIYALRLRLNGEPARSIEQDHEEYLPFFVAAPKNQPASPFAFLAPTYTYLAYGNVRAAERQRREAGKTRDEFYADDWIGPGTRQYASILDEHPHLGSSTYDLHSDGSPVHISSWLRPLLNLRPKSMLWTFCADLLLIDWLEAKGIAYDIITDDLLEEEGLSLLKNYRAVMTGNHPEYHTTAQIDAIESYLAQVGRLMYMGGNGFYWRCAVQPSTPCAIELRRGRTGTGLWKSDAGEDYLAFSGELGGIWRDLGRPPQSLVGVGFIAEGHDNAYYRILPEARQSRAAFLLENLGGEALGDFGIFGTAVGQEIDRSNAAYGTPPHTIIVARSVEHTSAMIYVIEEMISVNPVLADYLPQTFAEVVFFETPQGGAVFSVGSMAWCGSLSHNHYDNNVSAMTENAVRRFVDPEPFEIPDPSRSN